MNVNSHAGSKRNAGLLRAYVHANYAWREAKKWRDAFADGITLVLPAPSVRDTNVAEDSEEKAPSVASVLSGAVKIDGLKLRSGGRFAKLASLQDRYASYNEDLAEHRQTMNDIIKKLHRNLGAATDKAIASALGRQGS